MASVPIGIFLQIILMLGFGFPERTRRRDFRYDFARPNFGRIDVGNRIFSYAMLLIGGVVDRRAIAGSAVVALAIQRRRIVYLKKELQQLPVAHSARVEHDLDSLGMGSVVTICGIRHVAAAVSYPRRDNPGDLAHKVLYAPKQPPAKIARSSVEVIVLVYVRRRRMSADKQPALLATSTKRRHPLRCYIIFHP